jgi:hypothetical protein
VFASFFKNQSDAVLWQIVLYIVVDHRMQTLKLILVFQKLMKILAVKTRMTIVQHGQEMDSVEQIQTTCSLTAENHVINADCNA